MSLFARSYLRNLQNARRRCAHFMSGSQVLDDRRAQLADHARDRERQ